MRCEKFVAEKELNILLERKQVFEEVEGQWIYMPQDSIDTEFAESSTSATAQSLPVECLDTSTGTEPKPTRGKCKTSRKGKMSKTLDRSLDTVSVGRAKKHDDGRRLWGKQHVCCYCKKSVSKLARHLSDIHSEEPEVRQAFMLPKKDKDRALMLERLSRKGDYLHNLKVLHLREGELIIVRNLSEEEARQRSYTEYRPCPGCLGFVLKDELWRHCKTCAHYTVGNSSTNNEKKARGQMQRDSQLLLLGNIDVEVSDVFKTKILASMTEDQVFLVAKEDWLITKLGYHAFEKHGPEQKKLISEKMRLCAKLLIVLRRKTEKFDLALQDVIKPDTFDLVVDGVRELAQTTTGEHGHQQYLNPSAALKVGHHLIKCANLLKGKALRLRDSVLEKNSSDFMELYKNEWNAKIAMHAHSTLREIRQRVPDLVPCTSDLQKISAYLKNQISSTTKNLNDNPTSTTWLRLAEFTLTQITLFNKRRGGEASKILVSDFLHRPQWHEGCVQEFRATLTPLEQELCNRLELIKVVGKQRRPVPVLLTADVVDAMIALVKHRHTVGVAVDNCYLFAHPSAGSTNHLKTWNCLRKIALEAQVEQPDLMKSTKLRKYVATVSQVFNLGEGEVDWLARHLGHDIRTHREYYRLHDSTVELAKISKLLLALETSSPSTWKGKSLETIDLSPEGVLDDHASDESSDETVQEDSHAPSQGDTALGYDRIAAEESRRRSTRVNPLSDPSLDDVELSATLGENTGDVDLRVIPDHQEAKNRANRVKPPPGRCLGDVDLRVIPDHQEAKNRANRVKPPPGRCLEPFPKKIKEKKRRVSEVDDDFQVQMPVKKPNKQEQNIHSDQHSSVDENCKKTIRQLWTTDEKKALFEFFHDELKQRRAPSKARCVDCLKEYSFNSSRTWQTIQYYVKYLISKDKKLTKTN